MTVLCAVLLFVVGLGLLAAALRGGLLLRGAHPPRPWTGVVVNAAIGALAVGEAAVSLADEPARALHWSGGAVVLLLVGGLVVLRHRRPFDREGRGAQRTPNQTRQPTPTVMQ